MTGVKAVRNLPYGAHLDAFGEAAAQGSQEVGGGVFPLGVEVENLSVRVHSAVGAAAAVDAHMLFEYDPKAAFDEVLYGVAAGLALPTVKTCAVVSGDTFPAHIEIYYGEVELTDNWIRDKGLSPKSK